MNIHALTATEASYLLFAIKKTLRDRAGLTPEMEQFYDAHYRLLSDKLGRLERSANGKVEPPERHRFAKVRPTWEPESLAQLSRDLAEDSRKAGETE